MPTFTTDANGHAPLDYIPYTLTNSQSVATASPFEAKVDIDSNNNSSYYASNLANVCFQDGAGNLLHSWLESGETNTSTDSVYWVVLPSGIPANSSLIVYLVLVATTDNSMDGVTTGAEPNFSATYGQYDNGASVFGFYDNFVGTTLDAKWTVPSGDQYVVDNGFQAQPGSAGIYDNNVQETSSIITDWGVNLSTLTNQAANWYFQLGPSGMAHRLGALGYDTPSSVGGVTFPTETILSSGTHVFGLYNSGTTSITWWFPTATGEYTSYTGTNGWAVTPTYVELFYNYSGSTANTPTIYWVRTRAYPPNGVMPSGSEGTLTPISTAAYMDINTRFNLVARGFQDVATRFSLVVQAFKDIATRFKLVAQSYQDVNTRFKLEGLSYKDIATRFYLTVQATKDVNTRFKLTVQAFKDVTTRFSLQATAYKDVATRFILIVPIAYKDIATRFKLVAPVLGYKDVYARFALQVLTVYVYGPTAETVVVTPGVQLVVERPPLIVPL